MLMHGVDDQLLFLIREPSSIQHLAVLQLNHGRNGVLVVMEVNGMAEINKDLHHFDYLF